MYQLFAILAYCLFVLPSFAATSVILEKGGGGGGGRGGGGGGGGGGRGAGAGSGAGRGLSGGTGRPAITYSDVNTGGRAANYFSGGGGKPFTLTPPSGFAGREMGGGSRSEVSGTRTYGSGYPYSNGGVGVGGQPFPFGFWPIYWVGHGNSDEYGGSAELEQDRPGGSQVIVELAPNSTAVSYNVSAVNGINETYWMIGDRESVTTMLTLLVDVKTDKQYPYGCGVLNNAILPFNSTNSSIQFSNVIQWYRSSSFALAYAGYNNTFAFPPLNETSGVGWDASTLLPEQQLYSPFLHCLNNTISSALPILDASKPKLDTGDIVGIAIGSVIGFVLVLVCCIVPCIKEIRYRIRKNKEKSSNCSETSYNSPYTIYATSASRGNRRTPPTDPEATPGDSQDNLSTEKHDSHHKNTTAPSLTLTLPTAGIDRSNSVTGSNASTISQHTLVEAPPQARIHDTRDGNSGWHPTIGESSPYYWPGKELK
ncbi:hypothetical protein FRC14_004218 [Serendipita sp. 396]|nr:hypothetical protein FRC14_004218 [Serendipita sp. 396]KAG8782412.1 hypothetical protein FRC15_007022 [Serendipita sp. 397]KAG8799708.1 hypothetical protein FRC16_004528 [Serendipita sp. 398]KAG8866615.1 hypothetical protein FRC20_007975 [Serendipita sp. 405]